MKTKQYQPKTGERCSCKVGIERNNCPRCEGTGMVVDFRAIRAKTTEQKHTPGPWKIVGQDASGATFWIQSVKPSLNIARVAIDGELWAKNTRANARLIAAAPELLEALQLIHEACLFHADYGAIQTVNGVTFQPFGLARAAIERATKGQ